jgi:hypothetical protein
MKKYILGISLLFILGSCKQKENVEDEKNQENATKDSTIVGVDKDENGCLASAGYTWSKLNKECVRAFTGIQLNPYEDVATEDVTLCAYVLFNESGDKAEVFLPDEKSFILTRASEGKPWIYKDYLLIAWKGYVLKKADKVLFSGDGEIGNKVTGSDNPEGQE